MISDGCPPKGPRFSQFWAPFTLRPSPGMKTPSIRMNEPTKATFTKFRHFV
jgi:hypothetical protein